MGVKLAIDFGTTNSVVAVYDDSSAAGRTVPIPGLTAAVGIPSDAGITSDATHLIPTLLYVNDGRCGQVTIGAEVRSAGLEQLPGYRLFRNFKRSIGVDKSEARLIDGAPWTEMDAGQAFLRRLIAALPYPVEEIEQMVVTVPVAAFEGYTSWLQRAFSGFPPNRMRVVDESTAAALGYAVTEPGAIVLVIDFGGGTLDLSLVRLPESREKTGKTLFTAVPERGNTATVIAKAGVVLGGSDIDKWLLDQLLEQSGVSTDQLGSRYPEALSASEQAKITLSTRETVGTCFHLEDGTEKQVTLTRQALEIVMEQQGFYRSLKSGLEKVMGLAHQKGVYREDIGHVLLVGGTSLIPSVQKTLDEFFRAITQRHRRLMDIPDWPALTWKVENTTIRVDKPFTAVVEGALQVSAGFGLDDHLAHGYGLCYIDPASSSVNYDEIIPMGSQYPLEKPVTVMLSPSRANQPEIAIIVGQINTGAITAVDIQRQGGQAVVVAHSAEDAVNVVPINDHAPLKVRLSPPGQPGNERLRAVFRVDGARGLRVTITDRKTNRRLAEDALVSKLGGSVSARAEQEDRPKNLPVDTLPSLIQRRPGLFHLPLHKLAALFDVLSPEQVSDDVIGEALRSDNCMVRFSAAEALSRRGDREARLLFEDILTTGQPHQRASAAQHIYHFSWFAASPLFEIALTDADSRVREAAVFALCKMRLPDAYRKVKEILHSGSEAMRMSAVWGLQVHPDAAAVPVLELAAAAESIDIRAQALEVLGATASAEAIPVVQRALADASPEVQYSAALSLVELSGAASLASLAEAIEASNGLSRRAILRGLFHATNYMGVDSAAAPAAGRLIDALEIALLDPLPGARLATAMQLAWMRHPRAEALLLCAFDSEPDSTTRAQMLANLVNLMSPLAKQLMEISLASGDEIVRQTAEYVQNISKPFVR
jgi:molecular chaperone DnaK (HSP70)